MDLPLGDLDENVEDLGDLGEFVDDSNLFNVLENVDMSLLGDGLEVSNNSDNFEFFLQEDIVNPADAIPTVQRQTHQQSPVLQQQQQQKQQQQVVRSSVIVGRSPVTVRNVPQQPPMSRSVPNISPKPPPVLQMATPRVQILAKPPASQPQLIQARVLVEKSPGPQIIFTNNTGSSSVPLAVIPAPMETTQSFVLERKPVQFASVTEPEDDFFGDMDESGGCRTMRKSGHNAIEKRYRSSINDRILELKTILAGEDAKMNKSAILRKAIEYIRHLQNKTTRLEQENKALKSKMQQMKEPRYSVLTASHGGLSPPYSSPSHSPGAVSGVGSDSGFSDSDSPGATVGMMDKSRLALCMVMFSVLLLNPFSPYIHDNDDIYSQDGSVGRTILEAEGPISYIQLLKTSSSTMMVSMLNLLLILVVFIRIFVFGEPDIQQASWGLFWRHRRQAEADIEAGRSGEAVKHLKLAASALGRPPPETFLDCLSSMFWQLFYFLLEKLKLPKITKTLMRAEKKTDRDLLWESAETYHRLHSVLTSSNSVGDVKGLALALTALNLARHAHVKPGVMAEIYLMLAIRLKLSWPKFPTMFQRNCLKKAAGVVGATETAGRLSWLLSPEFSSWLLADLGLRRQHLASDASLGLTSDLQSLDPVGRLLRHYQDHHLMSALDTLVWPTHEAPVTSIMPMLGLVTRSNVTPASLTGDRWDVVADWWTAVLSCGSLWCQNKMAEAEALYTDIDNLPDQYQESDDPYYVTLLASQTTHRAVLAGDRRRSLGLCDKTSEFIEDATRHFLQNTTTTETTAIKNLLILSLDWQLASRTILWETEKVGSSTRCSQTSLDGFQRDLHSLRKLTDSIPWLQNRLFLHEATMRLMAGASPNKTQELLARSRDSRSRVTSRSLLCGPRGESGPPGSYAGEREQAMALLAAAKHLPAQLLSSQAEVKGMLVQAARMLDNLGDKRMVEQCNKLMANLSSNLASM